IYIGLMRFTGSLNGKEGSFVMEDHGTFNNGSANSSLKIISGSGMGELKDISGTGNYIADKNGAIIELNYQL
ncbi:MAG TPA: DUF3224 domain-containing protein, partial [Ignavibacteriaceae bacterium]|nr:DUF3224 domain-containing protein [Ignavibacteriaceae bacterium]